MIIDRMENLGKYAAISSNFASAVSFLQSHDLNALPAGRNEVDGEKAFVNKFVNNYDHVNPGSEVHHQYADLQIVLEGTEGMGFGVADSHGSFDAEKDFGAAGPVDTAVMKVTSGWFVIFFPGEDHAPGSLVGENGHVVKLVAKILMD